MITTCTAYLTIHNEVNNSEVCTTSRIVAKTTHELVHACISVKIWSYNVA